MDFIQYCLALEPAHGGLFAQNRAVGLAVVIDGKGKALHEFVQPLALLPETGRLAFGSTVLKALGVFAHHQRVATDDDGALGQHHPACEDAHALDVVVLHPVGLDLHRLVAVGFLGGGRNGEECGRNGQHQPAQGGTRKYRIATELGG